MHGRLHLGIAEDTLSLVETDGIRLFIRILKQRTTLILDRLVQVGSAVQLCSIMMMIVGYLLWLKGSLFKPIHTFPCERVYFLQITHA